MIAEHGSNATREEAAGVRGRFTISDLSRILEVSPARLRNWVRLGLIEPLETQCRLAWFDFQQAALAKRLWDLVGQGASIAVIRRNLERLRRWLPGEQLTSEIIARLEQRGRLLIRLDDKLVDATGQQHFDFSAAEQATLVPLLNQPASVDDLFDAALALEDAGRLDEAATAYEQALALEPCDPVLHFNLGNVRFGLERMEDARASYQEALRYDPQYAEAWNNLGLAYTRLDRLPDALAALRRAVQLVPNYPAACRNLSDLLQRDEELA